MAAPQKSVFVTGVTGYIGGSVARAAVLAGYKVYGLTRSEAKVEQISAQIGAEPVVGSLDDVALLQEYARKCDAVVHCADSDHRGAVEAFAEALAGTGKAFLHTSGSSVVGDDVEGATESSNIYEDDTPFTPMDVRRDRVAINTFVRCAGIERQFRGICMVPSMIYGECMGLDGIESDQVPVIVRQSRSEGAGMYVGTGKNRWSNVHVEDLCDLYLLALDRAPAGSYFYIENGETSYGEIAEAVKDALGLSSTKSWAFEDAFALLGDWARFAISSNSRVRSTNAKRFLGWQPKHSSVEDWIQQNGAKWGYNCHV